MTCQKPVKILLVDDEPDILDFLGYNLSKEGFQILKASGGKEAIKLAIRERPDLVVLDIMMPECDGIRVCGRLKRSRRANDTIILFLTAGSHQFAQHAAELANADGFILKPIRPHALIERIRCTLQRFGKMESNERLVLQAGDAVLSKITKELVTPFRNIPLKDSEFDILWLLASRKGEVLTLHEIREELGIKEPADPAPIRKYIAQLREKLGEGFINIASKKPDRFIWEA